MTASTVTPRDVGSTRTLTRTLAAEWSRLWTVRATWWFLAAAAVTMIGIGVAAGVDHTEAPAAQAQDPAWIAALITTTPAQFAFFGLALLAVTSDYATGGIIPSLQWTPRRPLLYIARTVVPVVVATACGLLLGLASSLAAWTADNRLSLDLAEGWPVMWKVAVVLGAGSALSVGLGFLLRSTAGGLVSVFMLMLVLPMLLPQFGYDWMLDLAQLTPGFGMAYLLFGEAVGMTTTSSVVVMTAWAVGALALGGVRFLRADADH